MHRINQHVNAYASYLNGKADYCSSFEVISKGHFAVEILEEFPCNLKEELKQREKHHIRNNTCVNKNKTYPNNNCAQNYIAQIISLSARTNIF